MLPSERFQIGNEESALAKPSNEEEDKKRAAEHEQERNESARREEEKEEEEVEERSERIIVETRVSGQVQDFLRKRKVQNEQKKVTSLGFQCHRARKFFFFSESGSTK